MLLVAALMFEAQSIALLEYAPTKVTLVKGVMLSSALHDERSSALGESPLDLHWKIGEGELLWIGARHVYDPVSPAIKQITALWDKFKPTIALAEGRNGTISTSMTDGVKTNGEGAVTTIRAREAGVPFYTWEPTREQEFASARKLHGDKATTAFLFLRGYYSNRRTREVSDAVAGLMLARRQSEYALGKQFAALEEFDSYWQSTFPKLEEWRKAEEQILWPGKETTVLNKIANLANQARDAHLLQCILDATSKGHKVWVTAGRSHVINYEPVLQETAQPKELILTTKRLWG